MKTPLVYVITLNWNGLSDTLDCLASLSRVDYPAVRTVVVDNASAGDQAQIIEDKFPDVIVLRQSENLGFCGGCNVGIRYAIDAGAAFVMLLNNDTIAPPDLIERLLDGYEKAENVGVVAPIVSGYPDTQMIFNSRARWVPNVAFFSVKEEGDTYEELAKEGPFLVDFAAGCCMLAPVSIYQEVGLLDERFFAYYDEVEWCYRIRRMGYESYIVPSAIVHHKGSRSTPLPVQWYLMSRNRLLWMKECLPFLNRLRSFKYLAKEYVWHVLNAWGLTQPRVPRQHSRAFVRGYRDYFRGKFYKWDDETEKTIFGM